MNKSVEQILEENGLDFTISKLPLTAVVGGEANEDGEVVGGEVVESPYFGLYNSKSGEIIHSVKKGYTPSQNRDIIEMVLKGMEPFGEELTITRAGALNGGKKVFIQLAIAGESRVGRDILQRNITIIDSNDGSTGLSVGVGDLTMSCDNQFYHFYKSGMKFRHTASIEEKIQALPSLIGDALQQSIDLVGTYKQLEQTPIPKGAKDQLIRLLVGIDANASMDEIAELSSKKKNAMDTLEDLMRIELDQKGENLWGLHSGVTRWTTHKKSAPVRENGRLESMLLSTNYRTNQTSLEFVKGLL
jgi:hypothetical protein